MVGQAIEKLDREYKSGQYDKYANIMKKGTLDALKSFCRQEPEFAEAVVQGGTFQDCMKAVSKNCGNGISDLDAYGRAVQFYFPTAAIRFQMTVDLAPHATEEEVDEERAEDTGLRAVILNLEDFL